VSSSHAAAPFQGVFDSAADLRDLAEDEDLALDGDARERLVGAGNAKEAAASSFFGPARASSSACRFGAAAGRAGDRTSAEARARERRSRASRCWARSRLCGGGR